MKSKFQFKIKRVVFFTLLTYLVNIRYNFAFIIYISMVVFNEY
jgi:hypothetical protein